MHKLSWNDTAVSYFKRFPPTFHYPAYLISNGFLLEAALLCDMRLTALSLE